MKPLLAAAMSLLLTAATLTAQTRHHSNLPLKPRKGHNITGIVETDGRPVANTAVSDGYQITHTDKNGAYHLKSNKRNPNIFITPPPEYQPTTDNITPQHWAQLHADSATLERHDFNLRPIDNTRHAIILLADIHLANQRNDIDIFTGPYLDTIRTHVKRLQGQGYNVYTISLGDTSWDRYWYAHQFTVDSVLPLLRKAQYPTPLYTVMGNHDNDPHTPFGPDTDLKASLKYQRNFGPRYYSQNIGHIHYIFLDNIHYINTPTQTPGYPFLTTGRDYIEDFTPEQLDWLEKDLATISHDTPLVIAFHSPVFRNVTPETGKKLPRITPQIAIRTERHSTQRLLNLLKPYADVHLVNGHSHKQCLIRLPDTIQHLIEHNITGTCAAWWKTRATGLKNIAPDGKPAGFEILTADGNTIQWQHHNFEYPDSRQFHAWDVNALQRYFTTNPEAKALLNIYPQYTDYTDLPANSILISHWSHDPSGTLTATENGHPLQITPILTQNPLHTTAYIIRQTIWTNTPDDSHQRPRKFQLFLCQAQNPDTPVTIQYTDPFGHQTHQTINRPQPFIIDPLND